MTFRKQRCICWVLRKRLRRHNVPGSTDSVFGLSSGRADRALDDSKHLVGRRKSEDPHFVQAFQNFVCLQAPHTLYENVRKFAYVGEC